ncbi:hypothetical protein ACFE04_016863 [Oxalis oulophora]
MLAIYTFLFTLTITFHLSRAQDSPEDYVKAHNAARAEDGIGPVQWSEEVAEFARSYTDKLKATCDMIHSDNQNYGENLAWSSGEMSGTDAVAMWVDEKQWYNYKGNLCLGKDCWHYTQVVWRDTQRIGCAKKACDNGGTIISCNYEPPGNYIGQHPY